ncbi:MAG: hypothetical protein IT330_17350 [Anaerolineae bacterium]|nr:hypothetical protein [Anaerolineae bacterium]
MEASNSLNLFFRHPTGYVAQITIRSANSPDLLERFGKLLAWLQETGCQPTERADVVVQLPTSQPVVSDNGHEPKPAAAPVLDNGAPDPAWCPIHQVAMKRRESNGQVWYSHKAGDAWCKGTLPKNGR